MLVLEIVQSSAACVFMYVAQSCHSIRLVPRHPGGLFWHLGGRPGGGIEAARTQSDFVDFWLIAEPHVDCFFSNFGAGVFCHDCFQVFV